jgi:hypothetical protein
MRRKIIQDFANIFCQKFIQLPSGFDLATFAHFGSGKYYMDILSGESYYNGSKILTLETCKEHKTWLIAQLEKRDFTIDDLEHAHLETEVKVSNIITKQLTTKFSSAFAHFSFNCFSEIRTNEKSYTSKTFHQQNWGFDYYYQQLYGSVFNIKNSKKK